MMRTLLVRGLIAGLMAGVLAALFAFFIAEPHVDAAIAVEEAAAVADKDGHHHDEDIVSRGIQKSAGLLVANSAYGVALGGLFAIGFAASYGRFGNNSPRAYSLTLAASGFAVLALVPFLKYPSSPPGVGGPDTIGERTQLYFAFLALSILAALLAVYLAKVTAARLGGWGAAGVSVVSYLAVMSVAGIVFPAVDEVPVEFPATLLWDFRVTSLGTLTVFWAVLGIGFAHLSNRALTTGGQPEPTSAYQGNRT